MVIREIYEVLKIASHKYLCQDMLELIVSKKFLFYVDVH